MDMNHIPDAAMTIAITALLLRVKRLFVIFTIGVWQRNGSTNGDCTELRKVGAEVEEGEDFIRIQPPYWINLNMLKLLLITTIGLRCVFRSLHYQIHR